MATEDALEFWQSAHLADGRARICGLPQIAAVPAAAIPPALPRLTQAWNELEGAMTDPQSRVRQNYLAIVVAAIACFLLEAGWYSFFIVSWMDGTGRTLAWLMSTGVSPSLQYGTALIAEAVMAAGISCVVQLTGAQTALRGIKVGALLWFGIVLPVWATEYVFEVRPWSLFGINAGFWLLGMVLMGAIVGGWKKK
jgi:hypothetical protein